MKKITQDEAERAYKAIHALALEKREITKEQSTYKATVKEYLEENPEGFYVYLEDARGNVHDYHVRMEQVDRVTVDKPGLKAKILDAMKAQDPQGPWHVGAITPSYIARCVEQGILSADEVGVAEFIQSSTPIKKKKIKGGRPKPVPTAGEAAEQSATGAGGPTMTVHRGDGTVELHRPTITRYGADGKGTVVQEGSVERIEPTEPEDGAGGNRWAI